MSYVHELNLSVRTYNAVTRFGIETVEELEQRIDEFAEHAPNCGKEARAMLDIWRMNNPANSTEGDISLDNSDIVTVDDKYDKAFELNSRICFHAQQVEKNLFEVCKGLKEMHDSKLYKELGYSSFEQYTEEEVGIKRHQAQKYIAIAGMKNGDSSHHFEQLGVTKLALLAKLDEPQREEIQQAVSVGDVSVRELKDKISALTKQKEKLLERTEKAENQSERFKAQREELCSKIDSLNADLGQERDMTKELTEKNTKLSDDLDVAMDNIIDLEKQINELKNRPRETFEDTAKIEKLTLQLLEAEGKLSEMEKQKSVRVTDTEEVFKAYMAAVFSSIRQLGKFIALHKDDAARSEVNKWLGDAKNMIADMIS